jgi:ABC-type transport system substrate-binding protein
MLARCPIARATLAWTRRATPALLLLIALAPAGCARHADPLLASYTPGPAGGGPRRGGTIVLVREEDPDYLDPAMSYGSYSAPIIEAVFRTLLDYDDAPGAAGARLHPEIARSMPDLREGGTLYCFAIRPEARFGPPLHRHVTAGDFKYSIERLFRIGSPGIPFYTEIVGGRDLVAGRAKTLPGVIARGDSLYIRIVKPDPTFLQTFSMSFISPVPREVAERWPNSFSMHTVATGPYRFAEFVPRRRVLMVRNPDYWGTPAWADTIELRLGVSSSNACALIRRGLVDGGFFEVPAAEFARMVTDSAWRPQVLIDDPLDTEYLFMNVREKPFDDVRVRQAVCWALDREAFDRVYSGLAPPAGEFLPPGMPGMRPLGRYMPRDLARARALLREAGYLHGFRTRLYGWTVEPGPRLLEVVQQQLAEIGIVADLDLGETVGYTAMAEDTSNHVAFGIFSWYADYVDPDDFFPVLFDGRRITPTQNLNLSMLDDSIVNAEIDRAAATPGDSARAAIWRGVDARIMDLAPAALMSHRLESRLWSPRVGGWYHHITRLTKLEALYVKRPAGAARPVLAARPAGPGARASAAAASR